MLVLVAPLWHQPDVSDSLLSVVMWESKKVGCRITIEFFF